MAADSRPTDEVPAARPMRPPRRKQGLGDLAATPPLQAASTSTVIPLCWRQNGVHVPRVGVTVLQTVRKDGFVFPILESAGRDPRHGGGGGGAGGTALSPSVVSRAAAAVTIVGGATKEQPRVSGTAGAAPTLSWNGRLFELESRFGTSPSMPKLPCQFSDQSDTRIPGNSNFLELHIASCPILADQNMNTNTRGTFIFEYNLCTFR